MSLRPLVVIGSWPFIFAVILSTTHAAELSLNQAVERALAGNRGFAAAYFEVEKAQGRALQAGLPPNPAVEIGGRSDLLFKNEGERTATLGVAQAFPRKGRLRIAREAATLSIGQQQALVRDVERQLIGEVQTLYLQALSFERQRAARQKLIESSEKLAGIIAQRYAAGEVAQTDIAPIRIEGAKLAQEQQLLNAERAVVELKLKQALGFDAKEPLVLTSALDELASRWKAIAADAAAVEKRPDSEAARIATARAEAEVRLAKAETYEDVTVGVDYENERSVFDGPIGVKKDQYLGFKVSIPLPVRNKNQGRILEQQAARRQSEVELENVRLKIAAEIAQARAQAAQLEPVLKRYREDLIPLAEKNFEAVQRAYQQGQQGIAPVYQAQQQHFALELDYVTYVSRQLEALIAIETASGVHPHVRNHEPAAPHPHSISKP